jgi:hypothetical protein|tara:strand:+ start:330 stop:536 length:207 start_codon:yes stop_codon:yes gene_type:complete
MVGVMMVVLVVLVLAAVVVEQALLVVLDQLLVPVELVVMEFKFQLHSEIHNLLQAIPQIHYHTKEVVV